MSQSDDNREKLQAMQLFKETHITKLELLSNATTIDSALHYIRNNQEQHKKRLNDDEDNSRSDSQVIADATTTGRQSVF
jgi:hypothetical protein